MVLIQMLMVAFFLMFVLMLVLTAMSIVAVRRLGRIAKNQLADDEQRRQT